ncbi:MAG TPA: HTTM domain-containing protein [Mycobacteriales bacterium]|nr:HTTM domain-containing protein [Mycobacteriales bacterium]
MTAVAVPAAEGGGGLAARVAAFWFRPEPVRRVAVLRVVLYLFVPFSVLMLVNDVVPHAYAPAVLYRPVLIPRLLLLPAPTPAYAQTLRVVLIAGSLVAATGHARRAAGWVVALAYLDWMFLAYSYGKVDHDQLGLVVALFVLPLAGATRGIDRDIRSEAAAWTLRCIQLAAVATYFLSAYAKIRHGGWGWPNSATFYWALSRRGTDLGVRLLAHPHLLVAAQWGLLLLEAATPVLFLVRGRARAAALAVLLSFHVATYLTIRIHFLPTVVCLLAFLPLERLRLPRRA